MDKLIANIKIPADEVEQAFRQGLTQGKGKDNRIEQIAHHYGYTAQREQFIEECSEAILACQKCNRGEQD